MPLYQALSPYGTKHLTNNNQGPLGIKNKKHLGNVVPKGKT